MNDIEKAIKQFKRWEESGWSKSEVPNTYMLILAKKALEEKLNGGWIPVSERLPTETERVLVTLENKMVLEVFFINNKFKYQGLMKGGGMEEVCQDNPVIAWQPLPEPYKEVENE